MKRLFAWLVRSIEILFQYGICDRCHKRRSLCYISSHSEETIGWQKQSPAPGEPNHGTNTYTVDYKAWVCSDCWQAVKREECPEIEELWDEMTDLFKDIFADLAPKKPRR